MGITGRAEGIGLMASFETRSGLAGQGAKGVLKLDALLLQKYRLRARSIQQRLFLRYIEARSDAAFRAVFYKFQAMLERFNRAIQHGDFIVKFPQREIIARQFGRKSSSRTFSRSAPEA